MSNRTSIQGTIRDKDERPVANAIVMITDGPESFNDLAAVTDDRGVFSLSDLAYPGTYMLQIRHEGASINREVYISGPQPVNISI